MSSLRRSLISLLNRLLPSEAAILFIIAAFIGAGTGAGAIIFIRMIEKAGILFFEWIPNTFSWQARWWLILVPALGGLIAGPIIAFFAKEAKGHGVPEVMQAMALNGGRIRPRVVVAKVLASAACLGSGGSAGREGPIVQVGAALGSTVGQFFHFSEDRIRNLVACGAAAGIAATFNAPIAGVIFSIEIILGELRLNDLGSVVISAVIANAISRSVLGDSPAFIIPQYAMNSPWEILCYLLLGILAALFGVLFIKNLYAFEDLFDRWRFPEALKPAIGGLLLGIMAYIYPLILDKGFVPQDELLMGLPIAENIPHVYGAGFSVIEEALMGRLPFFLLLALVFIKLLATSLTLGSGNSGGVFAPGLFTGAMLGGVFGYFVTWLFPNLSAGIGPYATVGMAAVFGAAAHAPLTAIFIVFEMTDDYRIILPLMAAVVAATAVSQHILPQSIYTLKLVRRGIRLVHGRLIDIMESVRVSEVMNHEQPTVNPDLAVRALPQLFVQATCTAFPVLDKEGKLFGMVSLEDYQRAMSKGADKENLKIKDIATRELVVAYMDEPVRDVLRRMAPRDLSRLPVVSREDPRELIGVVRRSDVIKAYELGVIRRGAKPSTRFTIPRGMEAGEFVILPDSPVAERKLSEIRIPRDFVVVSIQREGETIIPHGDIELKVGDIISVLAKGHEVDELTRFLEPNKPTKDG